MHSEVASDKRDVTDWLKFSQLPADVQRKVLALAVPKAEALPAESLPAQLARVMSFAPRRRTQAVGQQLALLLEAESTTLRRLLRQAVSEGVEAPSVREPSDGSNFAAQRSAAAEKVAGLYLVDMGYSSPALFGALADLREHDSSTQIAVLSGQVQGLQAEVSSLKRAAEDAERAHREELSALRSQTAATIKSLRAKLGAAKAAAAAQTHTQSDAPVPSPTPDHRPGAASSPEGHNLTVPGGFTARRSDEGNAHPASSSPETREPTVERGVRGREQVRARWLLDTLLEAAQGLSRELGLPPAERAPVDLVAELAPADEPLTATDPVRLDDRRSLELALRLPKAHLIVDGYNLTKAVLANAPLSTQRTRLIAGAGALVARHGVEMTIVFDAADAVARPTGLVAPRGVRVLFSSQGEIADLVIRRIVEAEPQGRVVVVVTDDQELRGYVLAARGRVASTAAAAGVVL